MNTPTVDDVDRIAHVDDPILRNLQITQCYSELSQTVAQLTGYSANWCTFATWASKQAGQTIRQEDLIRAFEDRFYVSPEIAAILEELAGTLQRVGARLKTKISKETMLEALNPGAAFDRADNAVARGNRKVFAEIGREFARFIAFFRDDSSFNAEKLSRFCAPLRPGEAPDGQRLLAEAFSTYAEARFQRDAKEKIELMLLANLCAGFHEQVRLQPEIAEALNAALENPQEVKRKLVTLLLPDFWTPARDLLARLLEHDLPLDGIVDRLVQETNRLIREVITAHLMTLHLPGEVLHLGRDLQTPFPKVLEQIRNPKLKEMLGRIDPTPDSFKDSGARDWADFKDRMHFITDFFRSYQERQPLFQPPFTEQQLAILKTGKRPPAPL
jgi:hypothetical protein